MFIKKMYKGSIITLVFALVFGSLSVQAASVSSVSLNQTSSLIKITDNDWNVRMCDNNTGIEAYVNNGGNQAPADVTFCLVIKDGNNTLYQGDNYTKLTWNNPLLPSDIPGRYYAKWSINSGLYLQTGKTYTFSIKVTGKSVINSSTQKYLTLSQTYIWPINNYYYINSGFGYRSYDGKVHPGIDIKVLSSGTVPVCAARGGAITYQNENQSGGYGNLIIIKHTDGTSAYYAHLASVINKSGSVKQGDIIGYAGNTGNSDGPHLHFGILKNGAYIDPLSQLCYKSISIKVTTSSGSIKQFYNYNEYINAFPPSTKVKTREAWITIQ